MRLRATVKIRNDLMIVARKEKGFSQRALADELSIPYHAVVGIERLDFSFSFALKHGRAIAEFLGLDIEDIVPSELVGERLPTDVEKKAYCEAGKLAQAIEDRNMLPSPDDVIEAEDTRHQIRDAVNKLPEKRRLVLNKRLDGERWFDIAESLKLSKVRVMQIGADAERQLYGILTDMGLNPQQEKEV
jgi:DNA-binding XRE family transcriptional regulator